MKISYPNLFLFIVEGLLLLYFNLYKEILYFNILLMTLIIISQLFIQFRKYLISALIIIISIMLIVIIAKISPNNETYIYRILPIEFIKLIFLMFKEIRYFPQKFKQNSINIDICQNLLYNNKNKFLYFILLFMTIAFILLIHELLVEQNLVDLISLFILNGESVLLIIVYKKLTIKKLNTHLLYLLVLYMPITIIASILLKKGPGTQDLFVINLIVYYLIFFALEIKLYLKHKQ